jgi:hypothetical protein
MVFTLLPSFPNTSHLPLVPALHPGQECFALLFSNFVGEKKEKRKQKNMTFMLV